MQEVFFVQEAFDEEAVGNKRWPLASFWRKMGELAYEVASGGRGQPGVPDGVIGRKDIRMISSWAARCRITQLQSSEVTQSSDVQRAE